MKVNPSVRGIAFWPHYKGPLMLFKEVIHAHCKDHPEHINTLYGKIKKFEI
jgi:hypothetical protein